MSEVIAFRPTEKALENIKAIMKQQNFKKTTQAINYVLETGIQLEHPPLDITKYVERGKAGIEDLLPILRIDYVNAIFPEMAEETETLIDPEIERLFRGQQPKTDVLRKLLSNPEEW